MLSRSSPGPPRRKPAVYGIRCLRYSFGAESLLQGMEHPVRARFDGKIDAFATGLLQNSNEVIVLANGIQFHLKLEVESTAPDRIAHCQRMRLRYVEGRVGTIKIVHTCLPDAVLDFVWDFLRGAQTNLIAV